MRSNEYVGFDLDQMAGDFNEISGFGRNPVSWMLFQGMNKGHGYDVNFCTEVVLGLHGPRQAGKAGVKERHEAHCSPCRRA